MSDVALRPSSVVTEARHAAAKQNKPCPSVESAWEPFACRWEVDEMLARCKGKKGMKAYGSDGNAVPYDVCSE